MNKSTLQVNFKCFFLFFLASLLFLSCNKDDNYSPPLEKDIAISEIDEVMNSWYLWNDELPNVNPNNFGSANAFFEALRNPKDRWSFIDNLDELLAFLENGTYRGYGFALKWDQWENLRVKLVYDASVLKTEGITRGWKLTRINGQNPQNMSNDAIISELNKNSNTFRFESPGEEPKELTLNQAEMDQNTVLHKEVISLENGTKVAYLVFDSFLDSSEDDLNMAFSEFQALGATELVLDLRYNGGGSTDISNQLSGLITGSIYTGEVYSKILHNKDKSGIDKEDLFTAQNAALAFDRLFVITSPSTASASEMVINGLKPYLGAENIILVGTKTHGKPVGMYVFEVPEVNLAIVPISFSITNANDEGEYFNGIPVDFEVGDDLSHDWGDLEEANLKAALDYIQFGAFDQAMLLKAGAPRGRELPLKGLKELIGAF